MNSKVYDKLKDTALIYLPGSAVAYASLADTWGWGHKLQVAVTITTISTFLGLFVKNTAANHRAKKAEESIDPNSLAEVHLHYSSPPAGPQEGNQDQDEPDTPLDGLEPGQYKP